MDDESLNADVFAAMLQQGLQESQDLLEYLVLKFEGTLSHLMTVRRGGGLFAKAKPVQELSLRFQDQQYHLARDGRGFFSARILKEVRGIVLKTVEVPLKDWLNHVAQELARQAQASQASHQALERFVRGS